MGIIGQDYLLRWDIFEQYHDSPVSWLPSRRSMVSLINRPNEYGIGPAQWENATWSQRNPHPVADSGVLGVRLPRYRPLRTPQLPSDDQGCNVEHSILKSHVSRKVFSDDAFFCTYDRAR